MTVAPPASVMETVGPASAASATAREATPSTVPGAALRRSSVEPSPTSAFAAEPMTPSMSEAIWRYSSSQRS